MAAVHGVGRAYPLGAHRVDGGTNFSVWSRTPSTLELLLFDDLDDTRPSCVIPLDRLRNRTAYYWHVFVPDVGAGQVYAGASGAHRPFSSIRTDSRWRCPRPTTGWPEHDQIAIRVLR